MFVHASIHTPCTAQPILQPKVKKTSLQEIDYVYSACASCYILRCTTLFFESGWSNPFWLGRTLAPDFACSSIMPFLSLHDGQAPQEGLAAPKRPQHFVDIAAPSSVHCRRVCAAKGEAGILALGEHVRDCQSRVTSKNNGIRGTLPTIFWTGAT